MSSRRSIVAALGFVFVPGARLAAQTHWEMWAELVLRRGRMVLMRYASTTLGPDDPPDVRLDECSTQRSLSDEGRQHARQIGKAFRANDARVGLVLSSPSCRCVETARLAFGRVEAWEPLSNLSRSSNLRKQVSELRAFVSQPSLGNIVLVSHGSTISALTGVSLEPGEMVILAPRSSDQFDVIGRLSV